MIYKYEMACKEAGLSEKQTAKIRNFLDDEKKKVRLDKRLREDAGIVFNSISAFTNDEDDSETFDLVSDMDLEELMQHKQELVVLRDCMAELPDEDREFLLIVFSGDFGAKSNYARQHNCSEATVTRRKNRLLKMLREKFFEKI